MQGEPLLRLLPVAQQNVGGHTCIQHAEGLGPFRKQGHYVRRSFLFFRVEEVHRHVDCELPTHCEGPTHLHTASAITTHRQSIKTTEAPLHTLQSHFIPMTAQARAVTDSGRL